MKATRKAITKRPRTIQESPSQLVPAVDRAIKILLYLRESRDPRETTLAHIARTLGINKSTCSNILRALEEAAFVESSPESKSFHLGPELIGLGVSAAKQKDFVTTAIPQFEALVRITGLSSVAAEQLPSGEFLVVTKIDSPRDIKATVDIGQHFPPSAPVMSRCVLAWRSRRDVEEYLARWPVPRYTQYTRTSRHQILKELEHFRRNGYTVSRSEYYLSNTAIAAPVFDENGIAYKLICVIGFTVELSDARAVEVGAMVRSAAQTITRSLGGIWPKSDP